MMEQLGITRLRPGPSGQPGATNSANYDPAKANPFPDLPDVLSLKNGQKVTTTEMWWKQRRPEIVEDCERDRAGAKGRAQSDLDRGLECYRRACWQATGQWQTAHWAC